jgi:cadherin EGF LAG seven-pass G-type receptor 1
VEDINDHKPVFEETAYTTEVRESVSVGSTVLTVRASDKDAGKNGEILYSIKSQSSKPDVFRIDPKTGVVSTRLPLDREKEASHSLVVEATDQVPRCLQQCSGSMTFWCGSPDPDPRIHASD